MLLGLSHGAVGSSDNKNGTVHLSSAGNHVFDIVGMARAVNVSIVTGFGLILNVSGVNGDTTLSLFGSLIDVCIVNECCAALHSKGLGDSSGKSGFTMVNVTDGTDVYMGLTTVKFFFCHRDYPPLINS